MLLACMLMVSIAMFGGTNNKILLHHEGNVKIFNTDQLTDALNASVDGDTIFLPQGTFKGFDITKKITVRGVGAKTILSSAVKVAVPGTPTFTSPVFESVKITGSFTVSQACKSMQLKKCWLTGGFSVSAKSEDIVLDRCYSGGSSFTLTSNLISMTVINSYIYYLYNNNGNEYSATFVNCLIGDRRSGDSQTYINCIIDDSDYNYKLKNCYFTNCLYNTSTNSSYNSQIDSSCTLQDCYAVENEDYLRNIPKEDLLTNKYLGNDGTIVGPYGGASPYDEEMLPAAPRVESSSVKLDLDNKKLNVTLKVTAQ